MSKPLVRLTIKVREVLDPDKLKTIGVLDINASGESLLILDRDDMGQPFIETSETTANSDWEEVCNELAAAVKSLQSRTLATEIAGRNVHSALYNLRRILEDSSGTSE